MALLAMLVTAPEGERTRAWLQDALWGMRARPQAQQSLRRELSALRDLFRTEENSLIGSDLERVWIDLNRCQIDDTGRENGAAFLEGFDIPGAEGFEDWLRQQRQASTVPVSGKVTSGTSHEIVQLEVPETSTHERSAVAILPFTDETGGTGSEHWVNGIGAEMERMLSRLRWLPVISSSTMENLMGLDQPIQSLGELVSAEYLLSGKARRTGEDLLIELALMTTSGGQLLWSETFTLETSGTTQQIVDLTSRVVAILAGRIETDEHGQVLDRPIEDLALQEMVWRARWHMRRLTREDAALAREVLTRAIALRPNFAEALILYAWTLSWDVWSKRQGADQIDAFRRIAARARDADPFDGRPYMLLGMSELWQRRFDSADELLNQAVQLNPSLTNAWGNLGSLRYLTNEPDKALQPLRTGLRFGPYDTEAFFLLGELAVSNYMLGRYEEAVEYANLALARRPAYLYSNVVKVNALARLGDHDAAVTAKARLFRLKDDFDDGFLDWLPFKDRSWPERLRREFRSVE